MVMIPQGRQEIAGLCLFWLVGRSVAVISSFCHLDSFEMSGCHLHFMGQISIHRVFRLSAPSYDTLDIQGISFVIVVYI